MQVDGFGSHPERHGSLSSITEDFSLRAPASRLRIFVWERLCEDFIWRLVTTPVTEGRGKHSPLIHLSSTNQTFLAVGFDEKTEGNHVVRWSTEFSLCQRPVEKDRAL